MDEQHVDLFIMTNSKYFDSHYLIQIRKDLLEINHEQKMHLQIIQFKDPTIMLIVSILCGTLGIDRFLIGDTGIGIGKLLTCGGLGIWTIIDWFLIMKATREKNEKELQKILGY